MARPRRPETADQFAKRHAGEELQRERAVTRSEEKEAKRLKFRGTLKGQQLKAYDARYANELGREADLATRREQRRTATSAFSGMPPVQQAKGPLLREQPDSIFQRPLDPTPNIPKSPRQPMSSTPGATLARLKKKLKRPNRIA